MTTSCDLLIVGGGILGLWAAKFAVDAGLDVVLVDKGEIGGGGSYGLLGALLPHLPNAANEKKRFQWQALVELPRLVAQVEAETGLATGYRQNGRLMPIRLEGYRKRLSRCVGEADGNWRFEDRSYRLEIIDHARLCDWMDITRAPLGLAFDDLSARAQPRLVTGALKAALAGKARIIEAFDFDHFDEKTGVVTAKSGGEPVAARQVVLAAGFETYSMLAPLLGANLGHGVKGRSALFRLPGHDDKPILYDDGVYVVPHAGGLVAVGSTAEEVWQDAGSVDEESCQPFIDKAKRLCPPLEGAELVSLWAGVRPRSYAKEPLVGLLPGYERTWGLTGGYKISFGIGHRLARALIERLTGADDPVSLPSVYEIDYHMAEAERDNRLI